MDTLNDSEKRPRSEAPEGPEAVKKIKTDETSAAPVVTPAESVPAVAAPITQLLAETRAGVALVKPEFIVTREKKEVVLPTVDDDAAEASPHNAQDSRDGGRGKKKKDRGQNKARRFHFSNDQVKLCQSLVLVDREGQFDSTVCQFAANAPKDGNGIRKPKKGGRRDSKKEQEEEAPQPAEETKDMNMDGAEPVVAVLEAPARCHFEHNLREYLKHKQLDVEGVCSVWEKRGTCASGWRCRWLKSHSKEENGELVLVWDEERQKKYQEQKAALREKKFNSKPVEIGDAPETQYEKELGVANFEDPYGEVVNNVPMSVKIELRKNIFPIKKSPVYLEWHAQDIARDEGTKADERAAYVEPPINSEEKRKLHFDRDTPVLAPLTTTGNLPFRRLCIAAGAAITYSEMAMSPSLLQGHKPEWALLRAHSEELPHFGAQICANKVNQAVRAAEVLTTLFPTAARNRHGLALIDLNCGCPIDLVYKSGGGSALLEQQAKLIKMLKGMNYVSGSTPITCKIRTGAKESNPTAQKLIGKLLDAGDVQAITLHGRSRQQRYTRAADWGYIADTAALIKGLKEDMAQKVDTAAYKEGREKNNVFFIGNGDCFSHIDYYNAVDNAKVDTVMVARGALIKPWIFEEIKTGQYLDKSATERLDMIREYCRYGLECWGSDEYGVATTRRFLLEWLSFTCRYVPLGILEVLPPKIQDRPPLWKGRNELETLLGSQDYRDWIKISEMFLGPCPADFFFTPKHKSNAHGETEAEG